MSGVVGRAVMRDFRERCGDMQVKIVVWSVRVRVVKRVSCVVEMRDLLRVVPFSGV